MPFQFISHVGYVELRLFGVLRELEPLDDAQMAEIERCRALLYDYENVEQISYDPHVMSGALKHMTARGVRVAAVAARPAWFGVNRQLIQWADLDDSTARVFMDSPSAVAWLTFRVARND
ncbi:MAG: hypothetical protein AB7J35_21115 [Dehalococcoidia bacterium]